MLKRGLKHKVPYLVPIPVQLIAIVDDSSLDSAPAMHKTAERRAVVDIDNALEVIEKFILAVGIKLRASHGDPIAEGRDASVQAGRKNELRAPDYFTD
jgi:hypothetical protein